MSTSNDAGVSEITEEDNKSGAQVIVAIGTGDSTYVVITAIGMSVLIAAGVVIWKKRQ